MKAAWAFTLLLALSPAVQSQSVNPLSKVVELLESLAAKVTEEGVAEAKAFKEYAEWCDDMDRQKGFEIKTANSEIERTTAVSAEASANIEASDSSIEELSGKIATGAKDLKEATAVNVKEEADFEAAQAELVETVDTLGRAIAILEREAAKNPALVQVDLSSLDSLAKALDVVIDAASFSTSDRSKLMALVQSESSSDDEQEPGAPAAAVYKTHSSNIIEVLQGMNEKAETKLAELRRGNTNRRHNFNMLSQSLKDQMAQDDKDLTNQKNRKEENTKTLATAQYDLAEAKEDLADATKTKKDTKIKCEQVAKDHADTVAGRDEELKTIAEAITVLKETTKGAVDQTYSFIQTRSSTSSKSEMASNQVVALIANLASKYQSPELAQLASRITSVVRYGQADGKNVFEKVIGLINAMIERLTKEAGAEAAEKAFCDEETAKTTAKKEDLEGDMSKLTSKIDTHTARKETLDGEVRVLNGELAALAKLQARMDKIRFEQNEDYVKAKSDLELGLEGTRKAMEVLRNYYGGDEKAEFLQDPDELKEPEMPNTFAKAGGAGGSIIQILEVVISDFAKNLSEEETEEASNLRAYEVQSQENKITTAVKEKDVEYKTKEIVVLTYGIAALSGDREDLTTEHAAVSEYLAKLNDRCIAKPETYEDRQAHRQAEIAGLKEALAILNEVTGFVQKRAIQGRFLAN